MSDHNFEKQIQQKLGELKVSPADSVWASVEERIRKDKRRRRGLILFPLLLLLVAGGLYFMIDTGSLSTGEGNTQTAAIQPESKKNSSSHDHTSAKNDENSTSPDSKSKEGNVPDTAAGNTSTFRGEKTTPGSTAVNVEKTNVTQQQTQAGKSQSPEKNNNPEVQDVTTVPNNRTLKQETGKANDPNTKNNQRLSNQQKSDVARLTPVDNSSEPATKQKPEKVESGEKPSIIAKTETAVMDSAILSKDRDISIVKKDSSADQIETAEKRLDSAASPVNVANAALQKKGKRSDFTWGITTSMGGSNIVDGGIFHGVFGGILGTEKSLMADVASSPLNSGSGSTPQAIIYKPSAIKKGFSFSAGLFIQKNVSKRFSVSTGLQYHYASNGIKVGRQVDSIAMVQNAFGLQSVNNFYRAAPIVTNHDYTNKFHFVELPLAVNFRLVNSTRFPVFATAGISAAYLFSTNALHFDSRTGVYYEDDGLFNKLQANISGGFSIGLWNSSRLPVHIGPEFRYGLSNLMKEEISASKRLVYVGLNTRFFLKK